GTNGRCNICHLHTNFPAILDEGERPASQPLNPPPSPSICSASLFMVIPGGMRGAMIDFQPLETCKWANSLFCRSKRANGQAREPPVPFAAKAGHPPVGTATNRIP